MPVPTTIGDLSTTPSLNGPSGTELVSAGDDYLRAIQAIVATQDAINLKKTSSTGSAILPASTTANRDGSPSVGYLRYNTTLNTFEGYGSTGWGAVGGGATGGVGNAAFYENDITITADYTITTNKNAGTFGPVQINAGVTVTIPANSTWSIV